MNKNLMQFATSLTAQLELMEGREKGNADSLLDVAVVINDFDFLSGEDGEYVVFTIKEDGKQFYFGGGVLTDHMKAIDKSGYKADVQKQGLPVLLSKKKSKANRLYTNVTFYPQA